VQVLCQQDGVNLPSYISQHLCAHSVETAVTSLVARAIEMMVVMNLLSLSHHCVIAVVTETLIHTSDA
jgi:hypothetical protein